MDFNMTKNRSVRVIVLSLPGVGQESLLAVLEAVPDVEVVGRAGGGLSAVALVEETEPDAIVVDGGLAEDELVAFLRDVKRIHPQIRLIVLTHTTRQQREILHAGADAALSRWSRAEELADAVVGRDI
jgi:DNA-binding NarL/FixJ family response regulator